MSLPVAESKTHTDCSSASFLYGLNAKSVLTINIIDERCGSTGISFLAKKTHSYWQKKYANCLLRRKTESRCCNRNAANEAKKLEI